MQNDLEADRRNMEKKTVTYLIVPEPAEGDVAYFAIAPDLPGLLMYGETRDELIANAPEAMTIYFDAMNEDGHEIPEPGTYSIERIYDMEEPVAITFEYAYDPANVHWDAAR
ncbi:MAG: type II toxin-antitoxin system HicB family antitoxin [Candidatus Eremiobacteraeota bacterium]|nr:type II toxin-antitoxin system HicB family antitoxin [Candidatus Eremiobacteraeota bacterium]